ncbi:MAG: PQQ-binding-like beta-propeller repeat protein [Piscinibacter sp.]|uniref:outer membrane protein assembly factor BamB family protein n=1 Tax=Piscinibacter sp. TaxID=1903157 RepID=UPI003D0C3AA2
MTIAGTDGAVLASALSLDGSVLYIGGEFNQVGRPTGCFVPVQRGDGAIPEFATLNGAVDGALPDGSGGWYIVGSFNAIGATSQTLGHVLADGSLHPTFGRAVSMRASAIAISGSSIILAGVEVSGPQVSQGVVAAYDLATGTTRKWAVHANSGVRQLVALGNTVYAGGFFSRMGSESRQLLAALDAGTGAVLPWNPSPDFNGSTATINCLAATASAVLVGGLFVTIGGATRTSVAALDPSTGVATSWDVALDPTRAPPVYTIVPDGPVIYVGGAFATASGRHHEGVVAVDAVSGNDLAWEPGLSGEFGLPARTVCVAVDADTVYVSGAFKLPGSSEFSATAAIRKIDATARPWLSASLTATIRTMQADGSMVFVGGDFSLLAGAVRHHIAAIDTATGQVLAWNPDAPATDFNVQSGVVRQLCVTASAVYAAGSFTRIGGFDRGGIAALDPVTGAATAWNPQITGAVSTLAASGSRLFVAGLTSVDGQSRGGLAAFDLQTGALLPWGPSVLGGAQLIATESTVYLDSIAFDAITGAQLPWRPDVQSTAGFGGVSDIALHDGVVYMIGGFDRVNGATRAGLAAVDATTGALLPWAPGGLLYPRGVAAAGDFVYVAMNLGGGNPPALAVAKFSISRATLVPSNYVVEGYVTTMAIGGGKCYFAGSFNSSNGMPTPNVVVLPA